MFAEKTERVDEFLSEVLPEEEIGAEIVLEDPGQADYQIQRIARLRKKQDEIVAFVSQQTGELEAYLDKRMSVLQKEIDWRSSPLEIYVRDANRKSDGKVKSLDLPSGKLKLRAEREKFECEDEKVLHWCDVHGVERIINVTRRIDKRELSGYIKDTGEMPEGVTIIPPGEPRFHLEIKE